MLENYTRWKILGKCRKFCELKSGITFDRSNIFDADKSHMRVILRTISCFFPASKNIVPLISYATQNLRHFPRIFQLYILLILIIFMFVYIYVPAGSTAQNLQFLELRHSDYCSRWSTVPEVLNQVFGNRHTALS